MHAVDIAVVGAGPAGTAAAITLARAGREVLLVDKATFPRDKCCGDGLTTGALRILERLGLDASSVPSWTPVDDVVVRSPSGREVVFPLPRGQGRFAAVARRTDLDAALVDLARAAGVKVADGHGCDGARPGTDRITLDVAGIGEVAARYAIGADGMWSPLRKSIGAAEPGYLGEWHAFRQYFRNVGERAANELIVWFEPDLLPGYAWSFPLAGGRANVGFGIQRHGAPTRTMKALWPELLQRPHIAAFLGESAEPEAPHKAWPIPARVGDLSLHAAGGRALFVGDAAAATDPMTGEGIGQALLTGELAAAAIIAAGPLAPVRAAERYEHDVRRELRPDATLSRVLVQALKSSLGARGAVRVAGSTDWTRRNFARWLFEDYPRAYAVTPGRWREHSLTGTGAQL
ncbi:MAG: putative oxidoreductase [Acidimicrobiales bacterium]|nr:putative oxidoreductase [Acidimicrobiales bacterium]